jgi:hypothetical protein
MASAKSASHTYRAIWIFVLVPIVVVGLTEAFKTHLIWHLRIVDFVDLVFTAPFFMVMLLYFNHTIFEGQKERSLYLVSLGLMILTLYGHSMHLVGNAINTYSTEINHYLDRIPSDTYEMIYFFDEDLGHWLLYIGLFGSMGMWIIADRRTNKLSWFDWLPGGVLGFTYAISIIESSQPWMGFAAAFWLGACAIWSSRQAGVKLGEQLMRSRWARFGISAAGLLVFGELLYLVIFGGFIQPSQMGF